MKTLYCRGCIAQGKKKLKRYIRYKLESNTHFTYKFVCNGLSRHIDANDNCFNYYHDNNLMELSSSVKEDTTIPPVTHTAEQFGLTLSGNGPRIPTLQTDTTTTATSSETIHSVVNHQVIHNVFIPPMDSIPYARPFCIIARITRICRGLSFLPSCRGLSFAPSCRLSSCRLSSLLVL